MPVCWKVWVVLCLLSRHHQQNNQDTQHSTCTATGKRPCVHKRCSSREAPFTMYT